MLSIYLITNNPKIEAGFKTIIAKYNCEKMVGVTFASFHSIKKLLKTPYSNGILIIDDCFEDRDVVGTARLLVDHDIDMPMVLISSEVAVAYEGYKAGAFRVLKPPIAESDVFDIIDSYRNAQISKRMVVIRTGNSNLHYKVNDILYVTSSNRETSIVTKSHVDVTSLPLFQIYNQLPEDFFIQCHKSCIVNLANIRSVSIGNNTVTMTNGDEVLISRRRKTEFSEAREKFIETFTYTI